MTTTTTSATEIDDVRSACRWSGVGVWIKLVHVVAIVHVVCTSTCPADVSKHGLEEDADQRGEHNETVKHVPGVLAVGIVRACHVTSGNNDNDVDITRRSPLLSVHKSKITLIAR